MGLIKEPLEVDFVVDPGPLTKAEEKAISDFIRADKEKRKCKELKTKLEKAEKSGFTKDSKAEILKQSKSRLNKRI